MIVLLSQADAESAPVRNEDQKKMSNRRVMCKFSGLLLLSLCIALAVGLPRAFAQPDSPGHDADWVRDMRAYSYGWVNDADPCCPLGKTFAEYLADANAIAANGFNAVVLWGRHYRFGYIHQWPDIVAELDELTSAFHQHGIKVFDHHSAALVDADRISLPLPGDAGAIRDLLEIDANSLQPVYVPGYDAYVVCPNKRPSQLLYSQHVYDLFTKTGLDGLMSDDVVFEAWCCVCDSCRNKCLADYGLDVNEYLPVSEYSDVFWGICGDGGRPDNPDWRTWVRFRQDSVGDHYVRVRKVMDGARPEARLMGCMCEFVEPWCAQVSATSLEQLARGANILFFEALPNMNLSYFVEWPHDVEQFVRGQSIGRPSGRPVLPLQYADKNYDELLFTWALDKTFGCRVWTTTQGEHPEFLLPLGRAVRWEAQHAELFREPAIPANIAVLYSLQSRDSMRTHGFWSSEEHGLAPDYRGWCEAMLRANIPFHVIVEDQLTPAGLAPYKVLILPSATCLSDKQCVEISSWTAAGGSLIATADCAMYDAAGEHRSQSGLSGVLGVDIGRELSCYGPVVVPDEDVFAGCGGEIDEPNRLRYACMPHEGTMSFGLVEKGRETPAMVRHPLGRGDSVYLAFRLGAAAWTRVKESDPSFPDPTHYLWLGPKTPAAANVILNLVAPAAPNLPLVVGPKAPRGLIVTLHKLSDGRRIVHALNATAAVIEPVQPFVPIPKHYAAFPPISTDTRITLREPIAVPVVAHLVDGSDVTLDADIYTNSFVLPGSAIAPYAVIEMGPVPCPADFNHDNRVDFLDVKILTGYWVKPCLDLHCAKCDLYADGLVDFKDLAVFAAFWLAEP